MQNYKKLLWNLDLVIRPIHQKGAGTKTEVGRAIAQAF